MEKYSDLLNVVQKPSRYLGNEINTIIKSPESVKLKIALAFPDMYEIGTSHFGIQILYHILNKRKDIMAERVYAPAPDMEDALRKNHLQISSLESGIPLNRFDIIGFSLLYELNYTNLLTILDLAEIPFYAKNRRRSDPIIIAGGPCTCNPEPVADFFDAMVIGDGEHAILQICDTLIRMKAEERYRKEDVLDALAAHQGIYIPEQFKKRGQAGETIKRAIVPELKGDDFPDKPIIPYGRPVHDRLRMEIARGCTRGCRFCQAGMIYRPVRERSIPQIFDLFQRSLKHTGYEDLSLLSLSTGDYQCIQSLLQLLMESCKASHTAVSLPSIRAGTLTPEMMKIIKHVRKTGFTIAPEAGSMRMRDAINKNIDEDEIIKTVQNAFSLGWRVIKLYFMIGLPGETKEDLEDIGTLVKKIKESGKNRKSNTNGKINVSVSTFIPKPHTPFQWERQNTLEESREKIAWLKNTFNKSRVNFKWQNPEVSLIEGLWSRGDRRLKDLLTGAYQNGCRFDGWSDRFSLKRWEDTMDELGILVEDYIRERNEKETLPWDHIDMGVKKSFLLNEREKATRLEATNDCRNGDCQKCGICDFKKIQPVTFQENDERVNEITQIKNRYKKTQKEITNRYKKCRITYEKRGLARYFGHLEMANIFYRAISRAGVHIKYTQGFHPKPKIAFNDPLPVGIESEEELLTMHIESNASLRESILHINKELPQGIQMLSGEIEETGRIDNRNRLTRYFIQLKEGIFLETDLKAYETQKELYIERKTKKGGLKNINIKDMIEKITIITPSSIDLRIKKTSGMILRPKSALQAIFKITEKQIQSAEIVKQPCS